MKPHKPYLQCFDCLVGLAQSAAAMSAGDDPGIRERAEAEARKILEKSRETPMTSPQIANRILREITRLSGNNDPYARFKRQEMDMARKAFEKTETIIGNDLRSLMTLAVLGNSIDFFKNPMEAFSGIPDQMKNGISFFHDDIGRLEVFLANAPRLVLYLSDNAGEIYFDLPLYKFIKEKSERTVLVVKGGASINDLTRDELKRAGLEQRFDEVADTGTAGVGVEWDEVSDGFRNLVDRADLILSKGVANFETLYPRDLKPPVFYVFKVKCLPIQGYVNAPIESFVALWQD